MDAFSRNSQLAMRIVILTNNFSGFYSFRKEVVKALRDKGCEVLISAPFDEKRHYFEDIGCKLLDTQFNRKGTNPLKDLELMLRYRKLLKQIKPDVVLTYTIKPNLYGGMACQLCSIPQIANITGLGSAVENSGWLQRLTILLYKVGLRRAHTVFFQNRANMEFCDAHGMIGHSHRVLIPGSGVNLHYHQLQIYPTEDKPLRFIFIGRLLREKGVDEYLYVAECIKAKYLHTEFHILGTCEEAYGARLEDLQNKGIIIYHGQQSDIRPFIVKMHCTIHPSFYSEGMSNVLLESCAAGRPIITTDRPGCGEIVNDGVNGYIVKQQDKDDLVEKVERFIALPHDMKRKMGLAAREKVTREFDRNIVIKAYLDTITNLFSSTPI